MLEDAGKLNANGRVFDAEKRVLDMMLGLGDHEATLLEAIRASEVYNLFNVSCFTGLFNPKNMGQTRQ